jgi:hypothetical protein
VPERGFDPDMLRRIGRPALGEGGEPGLVEVEELFRSLDALGITTMSRYTLPISRAFLWKKPYSSRSPVRTRMTGSGMVRQVSGSGGPITARPYAVHAWNSVTRSGKW